MVRTHEPLRLDDLNGVHARRCKVVGRVQELCLVVLPPPLPCAQLPLEICTHVLAVVADRARPTGVKCAGNDNSKVLQVGYRDKMSSHATNITAVTTRAAHCTLKNVVRSVAELIRRLALYCSAVDSTFHVSKWGRFSSERSTPTRRRTHPLHELNNDATADLAQLLQVRKEPALQVTPHNSLDGNGSRMCLGARAAQSGSVDEKGLHPDRKPDV